MTNVAGNWVWMAVFIPLWAITANLWFSVASCSKRVAGPRTGKVIDGAAVALSLCSAGGILLGLKCGSFIDLPLSDQACHVAAVQLSAWLGL
jgi:hypothetical protein